MSHSDVSTRLGSDQRVSQVCNQVPLFLAEVCAPRSSTAVQRDLCWNWRWWWCAKM